MFDKFEVLMSWKLSWGLFFLLLGVSDGHIYSIFQNIALMPNESFKDPNSAPSLVPAKKMVINLKRANFAVPYCVFD